MMIVLIQIVVNAQIQIKNLVIMTNLTRMIERTLEAACKKIGWKFNILFALLNIYTSNLINMLYWLFTLEASMYIDFVTMKKYNPETFWANCKQTCASMHGNNF